MNAHDLAQDNLLTVNHVLFRALGMALIKNGSLTKDQLVRELERFRDALGAEPAAASVSMVIENVKRWPTPRADVGLGGSHDDADELAVDDDGADDLVLEDADLGLVKRAP